MRDRSESDASVSRAVPGVRSSKNEENAEYARVVEVGSFLDKTFVHSERRVGICSKTRRVCPIYVS